MPAPASRLPAYVGRIETEETAEMVARARTLGQCLDMAMHTSERRAGARVLIYAADYDGDTFRVGAKPLLEVRNAGRGLAIVSHITEMPDRPEVVAAREAEAVQEG